VIGIDTNVLVRYLVQDDERQSVRAAELLERLLTADEPGYVSAVVVVELAWVLERRYRVDRPQLAAALDWLLSAQNIEVESKAAVSEAISAFKRGRCDFADAFIGALALRAGCDHTVTFDKGALMLPGFAPV